MPCHLHFDCLVKIFEYLEKEKGILYSCLLVNRLWCEASVRILWRNIHSIYYTNPQIFITLITCLPNESKDFLYEKGIFISDPTSKPPSFNYASFYKALSIEQICAMCRNFLDDNQKLIIQEILKMFMRQISSLEKLSYISSDAHDITYIPFIHFPGARDCLTNLSKLSFNTNVHSEFLYELSQICQNIQSLHIIFDDTTSNGLNDLISSQNNLKYLSLSHNYHRNFVDTIQIMPSLMEHSNTLIKLKIECVNTLSFITKFTNLQELILSFNAYHDFPFNELQNAPFPQLQILKFPDKCPRVEMLIEFLEINGKNLKEFHVFKYHQSLILAIAKFCPNMKYLKIRLVKSATLEIIVNSCQQLERIESLYDGHLNKTEMLDIVAKHSKYLRGIIRMESKDKRLHNRGDRSFKIQYNHLIISLNSDHNNYTSIKFTIQMKN